MSPLIDQKRYEVRLYRNRVFIGDLGRLARELSWTVNRNPQVGYNTLSFKVDQQALDSWCSEHGTSLLELIRPIHTDCQLWVSHTPDSDAVCVADGYLYQMPTMEANGDAMDFEFEFKDQFLKLQGASRIPNGTRYESWYTDDLCSDLMLKAQERQGRYSYGFTRGNSLTDRQLITREYNDWKPVSEAIAEMTDNTTGQGPFDVWINKDYQLMFANKRGRASGLEFVYPYTTASGAVPMSTLPEYPSAPTLMTAIRAVGEGQGDAAITTYHSDTEALALYGYIEGYQQYSGVSRQATLDRKALGDLQNAINPNPAPTITCNGVFIDWASFGVGDTISYTNNYAVGYGQHGTVRVKTIEVNCDSNRNETVKLTTE